MIQQVKLKENGNELIIERLGENIKFTFEEKEINHNFDELFNFLQPKKKENCENIKWEVVRDEFREHKDVEITLPTRATKHSAGYDICTPIDFELVKGQSIKIKTDLKCKFANDVVMHIYPRSSIGIKHNILLSNTVGVIDSDFYNNAENDGNITLALHKYDGTESKFKAGDKIAQAVFVKYETNGEKIESERVGGIGSTNK